LGGTVSPQDRGVPGGRPPGLALATWHQLLDSGRMQDGEPALAGTARPVVARMSAATAAEAGAADGDKVTVATDRGSVTVPVVVVPMADHVVWLPSAGLPQGARTERAGSTIRAELGAGHGATVTLRRPE
jgi:NADH-quinone oxidoreductase subunit G